MSTTKTTTSGSSQTQSSSNAATSSSSVSTKPVHPVSLSSFSPTGCELSTWAYITSTRPLNGNPLDHEDTDAGDIDLETQNISSIILPNLVVAHSTCLKIYVVDPKSGTLILASSYENLAGTIISLDTIPFGTCNNAGDNYDGLLLGFAGHPRMSIVYPVTEHLDSFQTDENNELRTMGGWSGVLTASSIIDLTPALTERSWGSVSPLEQDLNCTVTCNKKTPTVSVILGGGIAVATFQLPLSSNSKDTSHGDIGSTSWWRVASEPYILPLTHLSTSLQSTQKSSMAVTTHQNKLGKNAIATTGKVSHGFGDIISSAFLSGYTEPVLTLLHSNPNRYGGRTCPGRLGHHSLSTRNPLSLTAISVSIDQKRSVVLWSLEDSIPSDAFQLYQHPQGGVLVLCVNEILYVNCAGKIECCIAVNGWVRSTASSNLRSKGALTSGLMQPNPSPLRKLSIQLDASRLAFINKSLAILSLRNGSLYSLELHDKEKTRFGKNIKEKMCMSLSPIGKKLGGIGLVSTLSAIALPKKCHFKNFLDKESNLENTKKEDFENGMKPESDAGTADEEVKQKISFGLVFAGSRMGDSSLMMYGLKEHVDLTAGTLKRKSDIGDDDKSQDEVGNKKIKVNSFENVSNIMNDYVPVSEDEEDLLAREESNLYENVDNNESFLATVLHKDSEKTEQNGNSLSSIYEQKLYRPQVLSLSMFQHVKVLDSLTGLGPLGPACEGPIACDRSSRVTNKIVKTSTKTSSTMNIHPCGFGSSGGLAILTAPGLNYGSTIISEADCLGMGSIYYCPISDYIFLTKKNIDSGCMVMQLLPNESGEKSLVEVDLNRCLYLDSDMDIENEVPTFYNIKDILTRMTILSVKEFVVKSKPKIMVLAQHGTAQAVTILSLKGKKLSLVHTHLIGSSDDMISIERGDIVSVVLSEQLNKQNALSTPKNLSFGCVWSSGHASIFLVSSKGMDLSYEVTEAIIGGDIKDKIVAIDLFSVADNIFQSSHKSEDIKTKTPASYEKKNVGVFDEDDLELYGIDFFDEKDSLTQSNPIAGKKHPQTQLTPSRYNTLGGYVSGANLSNMNISVIALCHESGQLQLLDISKLISETSSVVIKATEERIDQAMLWQCLSGCGYGSVQLSASKNAIAISTFENVTVSEIKFFFCGPSDSSQSKSLYQKDLSILRSLCLLIETNLGDLHLYTGSKSNADGKFGFRRVPLRRATRLSKEVHRHRNKLRRKGIIVDSNDSGTFRPNRFHRFFSLSGHDGLFSASYHPIWFVSERGVPSALSHRLRHCAPAGGSDLPISGFCSGLTNSRKSDNVGFMTVHERIGKVGSQRMTFFSGLSDIFTPFGLLPGGGNFVQKIPLGVTVHQVEYINDPLISTVAHPLYALLISRDVEIDQSHLNDDGLTTDERELIKQKKEEEKMQKQVEADLGGFEVEQEWVEEIERENCFEIEKRFGGAPSSLAKTYEIWLVDGSDWQMVDTYELEEFEHGLTMKFMELSNISEDAAESTKVGVMETSSVLVIGTGIVDDDGEDVSSKGRILLFELKRSDDEGDSGVEAELNFMYDKDIAIGPVTTLNNLTCENKSRLVVGAGAEVTIEQWGNGKLLQVGFFHANMHVQEIVLFKTFFLLSDAYDSLHFLVWRESDKSLTLLAKDYEPACVYAAGVITRGGAVSFISHDDRQNLTFFNYAPNDAAARGGNKLVCRADYHLGQQTTGFRSFFCRSSLIVNSATLQSTLVALKQQDPFFGKLDDDQRFGVHFGSTDGLIGFIVPVNEDIYWRLAALQSVMSNALLSDCSLSQRAWRLYRRAVRRGGCRSNVRKKGVIDCDLIIKYVDLPLRDQEDLASAIGSTVDLIMDNLVDVMASSTIV